MIVALPVSAIIEPEIDWVSSSIPDYVYDFSFCFQPIEILIQNVYPLTGPDQVDPALSKGEDQVHITRQCHSQ